MDILFTTRPPYGIDPLFAPYTINLLLTPMPFKVVLWLAIATSYYGTKALLKKKYAYPIQKATTAAVLTAIIVATILAASRADTVLAHYTLRAWGLHQVTHDSSSAFASMNPNNAFLIAAKPKIRYNYRISTEGMEKSMAERYRHATRFILLPKVEDPSATQIVAFNATAAYDQQKSTLKDGSQTRKGITKRFQYDRNRMLLEEKHAD